MYASGPSSKPCLLQGQSLNQKQIWQRASKKVSGFPKCGAGNAGNVVDDREPLGENETPDPIPQQRLGQP